MTLATALLLTVLPAAASGAFPGAGRVVDGSDADWRAGATMVPGTAGYASGEWAYTDYPYDDRGAGGSFAYPTAPGYNRNAADVVTLHVAADLRAVHYLVRLSTLINPSSTVIALAVDTDGREDTGGGAWPYGADITSPGWEQVVTVWGTGGTVTFADGRTVPIPVAANTADNLIEFAVPWHGPRGMTWRYRGASGVWDAAKGQWAEVIASSPTAPATSPTGGNGSPTQPDAFNLLFRNRLHDGGTDATDENSSGSFQFAKQSAALSSGNITPFVREVDLRTLTSGRTALPEEPAGDVHITRIYATAGWPNALAEGVTSSGATGSLYNGRFQPYRLFVPESYRNDPRPAPLVPMLHGWTGDHRGFNPSDNDFWTLMRSERALVPKPLGRGQEIWYEHVGELDVLEVMADVAAHYNVDSDRIYLGGTSMGGLGTIKIAEAHPHLFAGILPSVPPMSDRAMGYVVPAANEWDLAEQVESLRNVPVRNFTGTYDPLVPAGIDSQRFCERLADLVYDHDCWRDISSGGSHRGFENDRAAEIGLLMSQHRLVRDPARVTYDYHPYWRQQAKDAGIGHLLTYDSVYWVSGITHRADAAVLPNDLQRRALGTGYGEIDVRTFGRGDGDPVAQTIPDHPSPTLIRQGIVLSPGEATDPVNHFDGRFGNISALSLDTARMSLSLREPLTALLSTDGDLALTLVGAGKGCRATLDGQPVPFREDDGRVTVEVGATDLAYLLVHCPY